MSGIARAATTLQIVEVVLVEHHAVVFKTEAAIQLRIFSELFLIDLGSFDEVGNLFVQFVCFFDVTFVELEVHLKRFI